ncbi:adenosylcobinamide-phosphate synthase CbiB [Candidatus Magnetaquicoccus inordinatus]|uniref:adenosylcobinamide-phosphate synthase CbiB n=1 Tax=Candidatus Magnetaquicoccus inordinatus TaxID=2496818 RepID=UPI00102B3D28|nr:adenosylcobinamide-phosphate synthase CbiB [Candidatus Magnetaquicoccus inordinatus]
MLIESALLVAPALLLDHWLGEPRHWHPLVGFGRLAAFAEQMLYGPTQELPWRRRLRGLLAVLLLLLPLTAILGLLLHLLADWSGLLEMVVLYLTVAGRSLQQHSTAVYQALQQQGLEAARQRVGWLVSRETAAMDPQAVIGATIESVLENGCDAVVAALFWFLCLGAPGALFYRLANTLDATWGYRNERYRYFGWAAARLDDLLNLLPARLTALGYLLLGNTRLGWQSWRRCQVRKSPNSTLVMAAGAGALNRQLGGPAIYHGQIVHNPLLGTGILPADVDILRANRLLQRTIWLWALLTLLWGGWQLA